jgi:NitT/TauT family transport system permease protein
VSGIKVAIPAAIEGAIIAEFIATGQGTGYIITNSLSLLEEGLMIGVVILLIVFSAVMFKTFEILIDFLVPVSVEELRD